MSRAATYADIKRAVCLGKFLAQDEDTVLAWQGSVLSQVTGESNIADHFTLLAAVGSVYACMYTATNCSRRGKRPLSYACCFFFLTQKRQILIAQYCNLCINTVIYVFLL